jgi:hypothetical protein
MGQGKRPKEVKSNITDNESAKMTTGKGTIQGFNGVAAVDKKHQIIVEAQAFGEGQEHHTLKPILEGIQQRYRNTKIHDDILGTGIVVTADTGYSNEANDAYVKSHHINAYIPDNRFRQRDKAFGQQKEKYGKRHRDKVKGVKAVIPASEFDVDFKAKTCRCPMGKDMWLHSEKCTEAAKLTLAFEGRLTGCQHRQQQRTQSILAAR